MNERQEEHEETLAGGNVNEVVRIGDTVRRTPCSNPLVYQVLDTLRDAGFEGAPVYFGTDDTGRDVFSFLPGVVAGDAYPDNESYMWSDPALVSIARLLRGYHDATAALAAQLTEEPSPYLSSWRNEVVCHNDAALYNIVFRNGEPVALIDFDMASPGPRLWDIAYTLYTCIPLSSFEPMEGRNATMAYDTSLHAERRRKRLAAFFAAYGMPTPHDLGHVVRQRIQALCDTLRNRAAAGDAAFIRMVQQGHLAHYEQELRFLDEHFSEWG